MSTVEYVTARANFVQQYQDGLKCCVRSEWEKCTSQVAEYYFSSGETRAICTYHVVEDAPCMYDNGIPISTQYYNEVYELK